MATLIDQPTSRPREYSSDVSSTAGTTATPQTIAAILPGTVDARGVDDVAKSTRSISTHKSIPALPKSQAKVPDYTTISTGMTNSIQSIMTSITELALIFAKIYNTMQQAESEEKVATIEIIAKKMESEATQIRESAAMTLAAGVVSGSMQIASGAVTAAQLKGGVGGSPKVDEEPLTPGPESPVGENEESGLSGPGETEESPTQLEEEEGALSGTGAGEGGLGEGEAPGMTGRSGRSAGRPGEDSFSEANQAESEQAARTRSSDEEMTQQEAARSRQTRSREQKASRKKSTKAGRSKKKMAEGEMFLLGQKEARVTMKAQAMSQALSGAGGIASAGLKMGADEKTAEQKETEASIEGERAYKASLDDFVQDARESMQKMAKMAADLQQAYDDTLQKIAER